MVARIIFFVAVSVATLAVILLAVASPAENRKLSGSPSRPPLALSLYAQHPYPPTPRPRPLAGSPSKGALVFRNTLTEGPENVSRVVGKAQGFIFPVEHFAHSAFNIIYLTFQTAEYSGSISVDARQLRQRGREELEVVGGTGYFAFARGRAVFTRIGRRRASGEAMYHVKLHLQLPDRSQTIPG